MTTQKLNRSAIARHLARGDYEAKVCVRKVHNPLRDDVDDIVLTDWVPARFVEERTAISMGTVTFCRGDLSTAAGYAYFPTSGEGGLGLVIYEGLSYLLRCVEYRLLDSEPEVLRARANLHGVFRHAEWNSHFGEATNTGRGYVARALGSYLPYARMLPVAVYRREDAADAHARALTLGEEPGALVKVGGTS